MSDLLLELSQNPQFRKLVKTTGLPLPMPPQLARGDGGYVDNFLEGKTVALWSKAGSDAATRLLPVLSAAGASIQVPEGVELSDMAEALGVEIGTLSTEEVGALDAIVFDGTTLESTQELDALHTFFGPIIRALGMSGRVLILGRPASDAENASQAAVSGALEGFMRSVAKEIGKKGSTAQLLRVSKNAEDRLEGPVRFFLSPYSAYVDGQPMRVCTRVEGDAIGLPFTEALAGKVALVTGAARGIGKATAKRLAAEGAHVIALDLPFDTEALTAVAKEVGGDSLPLDLTSEDAAQRIENFVKARHGGLDIVVHNAGVTRDKTLARMSPEQWQLALDVNLRAVEKVTAHLLDTDAIRANGRIVCLASVAGIAGNMGQTNYAASKSGLISYVRYMATPLAAKGICINAIAPGFIETRMTAAIPVAVREVGRRLNNLSQGGRPIDVAEAITFLSSPGAIGISGQVLRVCGGMMLGA